MKLKIRDMQVETNKVVEKDYLDLRDISAKFGEEEDNQLFKWVRTLHLNDKNGNPDPRIAAHVREAGADVERVLSKEVHSKSFSQDTRDSFQPVVTSQPSFDSSVEHSSRLLQAMMAQEERRLMMVVILKMMVGIMEINNKVKSIESIHW